MPTKKAAKTTKKQAASAAVVKKQVQAALQRNLERKWLQTTITNTIATNNVFLCVGDLSNVPVGTTGNTRIGEYIRPVMLDIKLCFQEGIPEYTAARVVLFRNKNVGYTMTGDTVSGNSTTAAGTTTQGTVASVLTASPLVFDPMSNDEGLAGNVTIVKDLWLNSGTNSAATRFVHWKIKLNGQIHYTVGGQGADNKYMLSITYFNGQLASGQQICGAAATSPTVGYPNSQTGINSNAYVGGTARFYYHDA